MGKNVVDKKSQNISVQDELYREILLGFEESSEMTSKKHVQLSTIQKQRVSTVGEYFLKNKQTNYFTETWVKNLSSTIDIDAIKKRILAALQGQKEEDDDDDIEEAEEEKKNPFSFGSVMKVLDAIRTIRTICRIFKKLKTKKSEIDDFLKDFNKIGDDGFGKKMKRILLLEHLQNFLFELLYPMIGNLCNLIFTYYDEKLIPFIGEKIEVLKEQGEKLLVKSATGFFPVFGAFAVAAWDLFDAGCAIVNGDGGDAAYFATSALLNVGGGVASVTGAGYFVQAGISALKMTAGGVRLAYKIGEVLRLDESEQNTLRGKIQDIADENFVPIVENLNERIETLRDSINKLEKKSYDYIYEKLDVVGKMNDKMNGLNQGVNFVNRVAKGVRTINVKKDDGVIGTQQYSGGGISFKYNRGVSFNSFILEEVGDIQEQMRRAHEVRYNFYLSDENLEALRDPERGLHVLRHITSLVETIDLFFAKVYTVMFDYFYTIIDNYKNVINDVKSGSSKITIQGVGDVSFNDYLFDSLYERIENKALNLIGENQQLKQVGHFVQNYKNKVSNPNNNVSNLPPTSNGWFLSRKTLRNFVPHFIDGYLDGFYIKLENILGENKEYVIQLRRDVDHSNRNEKYKLYEQYLNFCQNFIKMKVDKKYPTAFEFELETETNKLVEEIYKKLLDALS